MSVGGRNKSWIGKITFIVVSCLTAAFIMKTISRNTYILLPIWFFILESSCIIFKKFTQLSFKHALLCSASISLFLTIIITILILMFFSLQDFENNIVYVFLSLLSSVAGVLSTYSDAFTQPH